MAWFWGSKMRRLVILGAGGFAREVVLYLVGGYYSRVAFLDDTGARSEKCLLPPNASLISDLSAEWEGSDFIIAVGNPRAKKVLEDRYAHLLGVRPNVEYGCLWLDKGLLPECGVIITPGCVLTTNISLGRHVTININSTVGHDTVIGDYTTISPGCNISGNVVIGEGCLIGTGAAIREKVLIASNVTVGAGAVVVKNLDKPGGVYIGNPARLMQS